MRIFQWQKTTTPRGYSEKGVQPSPILQPHPLTATAVTAVLGLASAPNTWRHFPGKLLDLRPETLRHQHPGHLKLRGQRLSPAGFPRGPAGSGGGGGDDGGTHLHRHRRQRH